MFCAGCCCIIQYSVLQTGHWSIELPAHHIFSVVAENHSQNVVIYAALNSYSSTQELSCKCPLKEISLLFTAPLWALPFFSPLPVPASILLVPVVGVKEWKPQASLFSLPFLQPVGVGCDIFEDRPRLREWRRRVEDAVGKELFFQAHEMILNIKELSNIQIDPQLKEQLAPVLMKMLKWNNLS